MISIDLLFVDFKAVIENQFDFSFRKNISDVHWKFPLVRNIGISSIVITQFLGIKIEKIKIMKSNRFTLRIAGTNPRQKNRS